MIATSPVELALLLAAGCGAGWLGAWIGIGGGIVLVPAFVLGFGFDPKVAIARDRKFVLVGLVVVAVLTTAILSGRG